MSQALDALSRTRRHEADGARVTLASTNVELAEATARVLTVRSTLSRVEQALLAGRTAMLANTDVVALQALERCARAQRADARALRQKLAAAEAELEAVRKAQDSARARFSSHERDARAVERVQQRGERARAREHSLRGELDHEDGARFRSRG